MSCRVGMSTNPLERIQYWFDEEGHTDFQILASGLTYEDALAVEEQEARRLGCTHSGGGPKICGYVWSVYCVFGACDPDIS